MNYEYPISNKECPMMKGKAKPCELCIGFDENDAGILTTNKWFLAVNLFQINLRNGWKGQGI